MSMRIRAGRLLLAAAILAGIAPGRASGELVDRILAIVGGRLVTLSDAHVALALGLADAAAADPVAAAMNRLIERHLVLAEVDRYGLPDPPEPSVTSRVDALRAALARRVPGEPLAALALGNQRLHEIARDDVRIDVYLAQRFGTVPPTAAGVAAYYRAHPELFSRGGVPLPLVEVEPDARRRLAAEQRQKLIDDWIASLRRRADINVLYLAR